MSNTEHWDMVYRNNPVDRVNWFQTQTDTSLVRQVGRAPAQAVSPARVVDALQAKGLKALFIEGGIEGWKAAGGDVVAK